MAIAIRQLHSVCGKVSGLDLRRSLAPDEIAAIHAGMDRYAVLVFHDQDLTDEQQLDFSRSLGPLEQIDGGHIAKREERRLREGFADVSNLDRDGKPLDRGHRYRMFNLGNRLWHSDSSFRAIPAKYSILSGRSVPSSGGDTQFADMRAAYDALDDETKAQIEDLVCEHSQIHSRGQLGFTEFTPEELAMLKPVLQRLVRVHPATGRKSLYLSAHAGAIIGWPVPEARAFLRDLNEHATQREFVHAHRWRVNDLVIWDNRQTMHRVRRYDESQPRDMRRTTVAGEAPTVAQAAAEKRSWGGTGCCPGPQNGPAGSPQQALHSCIALAGFRRLSSIITWSRGQNRPLLRRAQQLGLGTFGENHERQENRCSKPARRCGGSRRMPPRRVLQADEARCG
jgi:alpha-ketoglutarate-dependent 2,4-dichlorophenoxyacetate dioxygenase